MVDKIHNLVIAESERVSLPEERAPVDKEIKVLPMILLVREMAGILAKLVYFDTELLANSQKFAEVSKELLMDAKKQDMSQLDMLGKLNIPMSILSTAAMVAGGGIMAGAGYSMLTGGGLGELAGHGVRTASLGVTTLKGVTDLVQTGVKSDLERAIGERDRAFGLSAEGGQSAARSAGNNMGENADKVRALQSDIRTVADNIILQDDE